MEAINTMTAVIYRKCVYLFPDKLEAIRFIDYLWNECGERAEIAQIIDRR